MKINTTHVGQKHLSKRIRPFYFNKMLRKMKCRIGFYEERLAMFMELYHREQVNVAFNAFLRND